LDEWKHVFIALRKGRLWTTSPRELGLMIRIFRGFFMDILIKESIGTLYKVEYVIPTSATADPPRRKNRNPEQKERNWIPGQAWNDRTDM